MYFKISQNTDKVWDFASNISENFCRAPNMFHLTRKVNTARKFSRLLNPSARLDQTEMSTYHHRPVDWLQQGLVKFEKQIMPREKYFRKWPGAIVLTLLQILFSTITKYLVPDETIVFDFRFWTLNNLVLFAWYLGAYVVCLVCH